MYFSLYHGYVYISTNLFALGYPQPNVCRKYMGKPTVSMYVCMRAYPIDDLWIYERLSAKEKQPAFYLFTNHQQKQIYKENK